MSKSFDMVVLGGGSAGYAAARTAVQEGLSTCVIEGGKDVGGLCILRGCMPSKTLLESAHRAEAIRHAGEFGLRAEYLGADPAAIRDRKRRLIGEFADYRVQQLESGRWEFLRGKCRFLDAHTVEVSLMSGGTEQVSARAFVVATGSEMASVHIAGLAEAGYVTSDEVLDADTLPKSIVVLGGGAIALELASFYRGLGSRVTVIQRSPQVLRELDADVADALVEALRARGMEIHTNTTLLHVEGTTDGKKVHFSDSTGATQIAEGEEILYALGRKPSTWGLGLDAAGVELSGPRIKTGFTQQTTVPHIFAAGDVCGPLEVVHVAIQQGEVAVRNAARLLRGASDLERMDYRLALFGVFTHPQAAGVGMSEREAKAKGIPVLTASYPFGDHGKSMVMGETHGFVKLVVHRDTREIVGAACIGPEACELIHEVVVAMHFRATAGQLALIPHYHPTLSEIWTYPAEELAGF